MEFVSFIPTFMVVSSHWSLTTRPSLAFWDPRKEFPLYLRLGYRDGHFCYPELEFRVTTLHNADALSRLHLPGKPRKAVSETYYLQQLDCLPVTSQEIWKATEWDPMLSNIHSYLLRGWPAQINANLRVYHSKHVELSVEAGCLMWGGRVIIPKALTMKVLEELHREHMGVVKMKSLARSHVWWPGITRSHVWWPGITKDLETLAKYCTQCSVIKQAPATVLMHPRPWPHKPWECLHIDSLMGKPFLIVVDAHSKWLKWWKWHRPLRHKQL